MKILLLAPTDPADTSFGGALRTSDLAFALGCAGSLHTLVVQGGPITQLQAEWSKTGTRSAKFSVRGNFLKRLFHRMEIRRRIADLIVAEDYDVIVARYVGQAVFVPRGAWGRLVIDPDDVHKSTEPADMSLSTRLKTSLRNAIVAWILRRARHVWIVNPRDVARVQTRSISLLGNITRIPDLQARASIVPRRILMVGYFIHEPNANGLRWFASQVLPFLTRQFPDVELHAVGKSPDDLPQGLPSNVVLRGFVEDLAAEYAHAELIVAPIASGGGSQIKVIEALAHGRPLVASTFSAAAFVDNLKPGEHFLTADTVLEWQAACLEALNDRVKAKAIGLCGHYAVCSYYGSDGMLAEVKRTLAQFERIPTR